MIEKEILEKRVNQIYQKYLKDKDDVYYSVCDIDLDISNEEIDKKMDILKENCYDHSIYFCNDFIRLSFLGEYESNFKIYIGISKEDYLTVTQEILKFITKNKIRLFECKIRVVSSNDCCVLRSSDMSIIEEINEYIYNNENLKNISLIYNPFVPKIGNVMIVPDFCNGSYNRAVANYLCSYFEKIGDDENKKINIDEFCDFVEKTDINRIDFLYRYILIKKLKGIKDEIILEESLFEQIKLSNSLRKIFVEKQTDIDIKKYIYTKTKLYNEAKKFFDNKDQRLISNFDIDFQTKLQYGCEIVKNNKIKQNNKINCENILNLILDLEKQQLPEEQIKDILEKKFSLINETNSSGEMIKLVNFFNNLKSYEHIFNTPELYDKMYLETIEKLPEEDSYKSLCEWLYEFYFEQGSLKKFLTLSTDTFLTIFKKALNKKDLFVFSLLEPFEEKLKESKKKK